MVPLPQYLTDLNSPIPDPLGLGQKAVDFVSSLLLEGDEPFDLHPVQERILRYVFGNVDPNGNRYIETLYLHLPSGQAKSTLAAAIAFMMLSHVDFRIPNGQIVVAAATKQQARATAFGMVENFIKREFAKPIWDHEPKAMESRFKIVSNAVEQSIEHIASGSTLKVLSRAPESQEGLSVYLLIAEETHAWNRPRLWPVLRKSQAKVRKTSPLTVVATTAGVGHGGVGFDLYSQAKDIATGKVKNESWCPVIYEADKDDDWHDESVWHRVNFALGSFKRLSTLRNLFLEAKTSVTARREFERYHLNIWHDGTLDPWITREAYAQGAEKFDIDDVRYLPCFIGVDAGAVSDLTAVVAVFHDVDARTFYAVPYIWCPAESIVKRSEEEGVPYAEWAANGFIEETEGASIDEDVIEQKLIELCDQFDVHGIGFDPYNLKKMMGRLLDAGLPVIEIAQRYSHMSPAMKGTEKAVIDGRFIHGDHPVLKWNFMNVPVPKPDPNGNIKPSKSQSRSLKIDGAVASMMAVYLATVAEEHGYLSAEMIVGNQEIAANG
ncbi:terminase large subunit [Rhizobium puerariae]|uniref:Terminase large subunit n=1 Tax=Rhizobium puerariae TaxID=1585791 RepID=A0ABV6ANJ1_9HYPH